MLLLHGHRLLERTPSRRRIAIRLERALAHHARGRRPSQAEAGAGLALLALVDVGLVIAGSVGMVTAALAIGHRWGVSEAVIGVLVLAPLTSIPNSLTAIRLGRAGRGSALVSEAFNSNTINLAIGLLIPSLFVLPPVLGTAGRADLAWLAGMSLVSVGLLLPRRGLERPGGMVLVGLYGLFVAVHMLLS
jgi:cation:H+ antiporter